MPHPGPTEIPAQASKRHPDGSAPERGDPAHRPSWTFLTNHGHVLIAVADNPDMLVEDIAGTVGITPRATLHILKELEDAGYLHRVKTGRRTHYTVEEHQHFRHPAAAHQEIGALLEIFSLSGYGNAQEESGRAGRAAGTPPLPKDV